MSLPKTTMPAPATLRSVSNPAKGPMAIRTRDPQQQYPTVHSGYSGHYWTLQEILACLTLNASAKPVSYTPVQGPINDRAAAQFKDALTLQECSLPMIMAEYPRICDPL